jgi:hypothetical protein
MLPDDVAVPPIISNFILPDEVAVPPIMSNFIFPDDVAVPPIISNFIFPDDVAVPPIIFELLVSGVVKEVKVITKENRPIVKIAFFIIWGFLCLFFCFKVPVVIYKSLQCKITQEISLFIIKKRVYGRVPSFDSE